MKQLLSAVVLTTALVPIASADGIPPSYKAPVVNKPFSWTGSMRASMPERRGASPM